MMKTRFSGNFASSFKRITAICLLLCFAAASGFAEIISFGTNFRHLQNSLETMKVSFLIPDAFEYIAVPQKGTELYIKFALRPKAKPSEMSTTRSFKSTNSLSDEHTEVRHCLFLDKGTTAQSFDREFIVFMLNCASLVSGRELTLADFSAISKAEVSKTCKADIGYICYVANPHSRFASGYSQMMLEFYGKQGTGIVMRATVSNTSKALTSSTGAFMKARRTFSF
ncbi:MAG: hypothetical protein IKQ84_01400 [Spirochaetaceae bacterium]|nr:hypothetical protein [Spirochaetaceae bacterium]